MLQTFAPFTAGDLNIEMVELRVGQAISLAQFQAKLERQLSAFLGYVLEDKTAPYEMTVQQRYYCLLKYLVQQVRNDLAPSIDVNEFFIDEHKPWIATTEVDGIGFRQLNGYEVEALENCSTGLDDWLFGAMALQIATEQLPYIQPLTDVKMAERVISSRRAQFLSLGQQSIDDLYDKYLKADEEMASLVYIGFDSEGVILYPVQGGDDKLPARFQCDTAIYGITKRIFSAVATGSTAPTE